VFFVGIKILICQGHGGRKVVRMVDFKVCPLFRYARNACNHKTNGEL